MALSSLMLLFAGNASATWKRVTEIADYKDVDDDVPTKTVPTITATYLSILGTDQNEGLTVSYDGNGDLTATSSDVNVATVGISGTAVNITPKAQGSTKITVSAGVTTEYIAAKREYILTVRTVTALPFSFDGGKDDIASTAGMSQTGLGGDYSASPKLRFDSSGDEVVVFFNGQAGTLSYDVKGNPSNVGWSGTFEVLESSDGVNYTSVASHTSLKNTSTSFTNSLSADSRFVKFVYTTKSEGNVALGNIKINRGFTKSISARKMATMYLPYAVSIPSGAKAYVAETDGVSAITLKKIAEGQIPANTGVIVYADVDAATNFDFAEVAYTGTQDFSANCLKGVAVKTAYNKVDDYDATNYNYYALMAKGDSEVEFRKVSSGSYAANSAYLVLPASAGVKVNFSFDDDATGIQLINDNDDDRIYYNLKGMRVDANYKGIVIKNGKKYINQ